MKVANAILTILLLLFSFMCMVQIDYNYHTNERQEKSIHKLEQKVTTLEEGTSQLKTQIETDKKTNIDIIEKLTETNETLSKRVDEQDKKLQELRD